ncbi:MAG: glycosyltransferase [Planctomycetota bacterium]|nr:glycosyltransferase [Planctomycetota bacterium]
MLTNETPDLLRLFTPDEHLATFIGQKDLDDKLNFYTSNHEDRERIARQGYEYARREHTYLKRAEQMVEEMINAL